MVLTVTIITIPTITITIIMVTPEYDKLRIRILIFRRIIIMPIVLISIIIIITIRLKVDFRSSCLGRLAPNIRRNLHEGEALEDSSEHSRLRFWGFRELRGDWFMGFFVRLGV